MYLFDHFEQTHEYNLFLEISHEIRKSELVWTLLSDF